QMDDLDEVIKTVENGDDTMQEQEFQKLMEEIMSSQATLQESENDAYKSSTCASTLLKLQYMSNRLKYSAMNCRNFQAICQQKDAAKP
ncbi:hypothetical protein HDU83_000621, partial [Entophlyctis luteolus]